MKILSSWQKEIAVIGFGSHRHAINVRSFTSLFIDGCSFVSCGAYFFIEAQSFQEYAESIFVSTAAIGKTTSFAIALSRVQYFFDCLNVADQIVDDSEFHMNSYCDV